MHTPPQCSAGYSTSPTHPQRDRYSNNLEDTEKVTALAKLLWEWSDNNACDQIVKMGWVYEQLPSTAHTLVWQRKLLVLRGDHIQIHHTFPVRAPGD